MNKNSVDDLNTSQNEARQLLENLSRNGFNGDIDKLALALGRTKPEIEDLLSGKNDLDNDLLVKIRGIAEERQINLE